MPTPVITARQCLTQEAAQALDDAVAVARRRGHAQTTSLHMVSALLSLPSSALREACNRARSSAYSTRIQFKALELCLSVSLDRMASAGNKVEEPVVSNSFMAAIKRSQANQRRQPENFSLYQQQSQSPSSISTVRVELHNLIVSILDDPVVSRVFGEAGFRSCDIKLAILRPVHQLFRYSRYKGPPMFLGNFAGDSNVGRRGFSFPFMGFSGFSEPDENCRRIGEILVRNKNRSPLLVGVSAIEALKNFLETLQRKRGGGALPLELSGYTTISIENEVSKFINGDKSMKSKFDELGNIIQHSIGPGVIINVGDLEKLTVHESAIDDVSYLVHQLGNLLEISAGKLRLISGVGRYETYLKFLNRFPSIEKDWDLQLLQINFLKASMGESWPRSSLMESFVPFGGFFSSLPTSNNPPITSLSRCHLCNEKCEQELIDLSEGKLNSSVADHYRSSLPSWLNPGFDIVKAKDDGFILDAKIDGIHKKWDYICQRVHHTRPVPDPPIGFQPVENNSGGRRSIGNDTHSSEIDGLESPTTGSSVTTDLGLCSHPDFKTIYSVISKKIGRQEEAISLVCQTLARAPPKTEKRGDLWLNFAGPDRIAKKKIAVALAETVFGPGAAAGANIIHVDLGSAHKINGQDLKFRGKTLVDHVAEELRNKPLSVLFLENIENADVLVQSSLSQAIKNGRFSDTNGREIGVNNSIFITTSNFESDLLNSTYTEENIAKVKASPIQMSFGFDIDHDFENRNTGLMESEVVLIGSRSIKRKRANLDLNLPAQETETVLDGDCLSHKSLSSSWLTDFLNRVDRNVEFKPLDYDSIAEKLTDEIESCFVRSVGSDCCLEIDRRVMEQFLLAVFESEYGNVEDWIRVVLSRGFVEAKEKYGLNSGSVLKIMNFEGLVCEQEPKVLLPDRIILK